MSTTAPDLVVTGDARVLHRGTLTIGTRSYPCVLGRSGIRADKREGDGATPAGRWPLRQVFYRADRGPQPETTLPIDAIQADDGWCDAPDDAAYNKPVKLPYPASAESMRRDDRLYDVVVVLGYNDDPVKPGAGSAIFLHVMPEDGGPTAGCVGLSPEHLRDVLKLAGPRSAVVVRIES